MQIDYSMIVKFASLAILAIFFLYALLALFRNLRAIGVEEKVNSMRLSAFQERARYFGVKAQQAKAKKEHAWSGTRKFRLDRVVDEAKDIRSFYLVPHDGKSLPAFDPGQYLTFQLDVPGQDRPVVRCYSLSDSPLAREHYRISVKRLGPSPDAPQSPPGISSNHFHLNLCEGDILDCKAPGGNFILDMAEHGPIVLVAGGIGITPMLSMLRSVAMSGSKRETWLFYGVRDKSEVVQAEMLRELADAHENIHIRLCFSDPREGLDFAGQDFDHAERVSVALMHSVLPSTNFNYYICGPAPMMNAITGDLAAAGIQKSKIHYESFGPASVKPKAIVSAANASEQAFKINFSKSGKELEWLPSDGPILDFAEANDIELDCGCRAGSCGTCAIAVRSGEIDYIDDISVEPEKGSCLACMAIPKGDLVIDV